METIIISRIVKLTHNIFDIHPNVDISFSGFKCELLNIHILNIQESIVNSEPHVIKIPFPLLVKKNYIAKAYIR